MSDPTSSEPNTATSGRATSGRFARGNHFGPGNPFARKTAALRQALLDMVTEKDIQEIATLLLLDAKAGDKAAIKLLFQYVIGKPQPAVDPDTLDLHELRGYQAGALPPEVLEEMQRGLPVSLLLKLWPFLQFAKEQANVEAVAAQPAAHEQAQRQPEPAPSTNGDNGHAAIVEAHAAPSPNGFHGNNGVAEEGPPPSPNGDNGGLIDFLNRWLRERPLPSNGAPQP